MIRLTAFLLFLFSLPLQADTQVTHTFEDGEVISAEEFNKNFDDLEAAIDAVGGGGGGGGAGTFVWRDANGNLFPYFGGSGSVVYNFPESERVFQIYYDGNYIAASVYFPTSECSGDGFMKVENWPEAISAGRSNTHWLVPDYSASPTEFPALGAGNWSKLDSGSCQAGADTANHGDVLPVIQSSAPLNPITAPVVVIWAD